MLITIKKSGKTKGFGYGFTRAVHLSIIKKSGKTKEICYVFIRVAQRTLLKNIMFQNIYSVGICSKAFGHLGIVSLCFLVYI